MRRCDVRTRRKGAERLSRDNRRRATVAVKALRAIAWETRQERDAMKLGDALGMLLAASESADLPARSLLRAALVELEQVDWNKSPAQNAERVGAAVGYLDIALRGLQ